MISVDESPIRAMSASLFDGHHVRVPIWCRRPRVWFLFFLIMTTLGALSMAWFLMHEGLDRADKWSSVAFGFVGASGVAAGALLWLWRLGDSAGDGSLAGHATALSRLADAQREQWTAEQVARRVRDPWPLNVRWLSSPRAQAVMASWASISGVPGAGPVAFDGGYEQIASLFDDVDVPRRLVVLGEPGSGKTMLVLHLTLQLLSLRKPEDPVPVLLTAAGWNPAQPLDDWIAEQVAAVDWRLARRIQGPDATHRTVARDLVARGLILPVLDGLDEMDEGIQRAALAGIATGAGGGRSLVVTCRTRPYEAAVGLCGPIPAAAVVELQPVSAVEAAQHLADSAALTDNRWQAVVTHLTGGNSTPLTAALSTPLMIWLARIVYQGRSADPSQLLTAQWADSRQGIEHHLLDHLVPAAYAIDLGVYPARTVVETDRAYRWLATMARHMRDQRVHEIAWWHLADLSPAPRMQVFSVLFAALTAGWSVFGAFMLAAAIGSSSNNAIINTPLGAASFSGVMFGTVMTFGRLFFTDRRLPRRITLRGLTRIFLAIGIPAGLFAALYTVPEYGAVTALLGGACALLSAGLTAALGSGATVAEATSSHAASLRADRMSALIAGGTSAIATTFLFIATVGSADLLPWLVGLPAVVAVIALSAWGQFCLARLTLAVFRRTPVRMVFAFEEAYFRGVFRRSGAYYQFRHILLRDRIAASAGMTSNDQQRGGSGVLS